ncbi:MAG: 30S ribosomal protein S8 [Spirochaetes bacterium]|nr:30S ribosomal protein S8 [Spirochaetota bacterium]
MSITDPIANLLTIIRNGAQAQKEHVDVPSSNLKVQIVKILKDEDFISNYKIIRDNKQNIIRIFLLYKDGKSVITYIKRISKPSLRIYKKYKEVKRVLNGYGISIYSTPKGLLTDRKARELKQGGELICTVW